MCLLSRSVKGLRFFLSAFEGEQALKPDRSEKTPKAEPFNTLCVCLVLAMGLLLTACSGDDEKSTKNNPNGTTGGETTGGEGTAGTAGNAGATGNTGGTASTGTTPATSSAPSGSDHWILSQPFQRIEAGSFTMGSPSGERLRDSDEGPVQVRITKPFEIMTTEVTQSQWVKVMGSNPSLFKTQEHCDDHKNDMCPNHPVEQVSWNDVQEFIGKLNEALGLTGCDGTPNSAKNCYRLPTEAEWEYSARGGTKTIFSFGDNSANIGDYAWYRGNSNSQTHAVGSKRANPFGLYDVHGNVGEWVQDRYVENLPGDDDPLSTSGSIRVIRGGSWNYYAWYLRSATRHRHRQSVWYDNVGFRLVRTLST